MFCLLVFYVVTLHWELLRKNTPVINMASLGLKFALHIYNIYVEDLVGTVLSKSYMLHKIDVRF